MSATLLLGGQVDKIQGGHDDGSDDGILHIKTLHQGLVKVPLTIGGVNQDFITTIGTATATLSAVNTNTDGTQLCINISVPAVTSGVSSGVWIERTLWGRRIGVRFRRNNSATLPPFTVWVDGVPYSVRNVNQRRHAVTLMSTSDFEGLYLIGDDLGPGPHTVRVSIAGDVIGGATRSMIFHGWVCDRAAGYEPRRGASVSTSPVALTTSAVVIPVNNPSGLVRKLYFHNSDAAQRIVTVSQGSTTAFRVLTLAAATSGEIDFGEGVQASIVDLRWKADAGAVVNAWVEELT